jgi:hypothetical protein
MTMKVDFTSSVELARLAPSVHNTQPWRFRVQGDTLVLSRDPDRRLSAMDPSGRQQAISCGAALHLARLDLRLQGFDSVVDYVPAGGPADDLAVVRPVPGHEVATQDVIWSRAARSRHTQRERFAARPVDPAVVAGLRAAAEVHGAWVRVIGPDELPSLAVLLSHAEELEQDDPAYQAELAEWTRRPATAHDGVPPEATSDPTGRASTVRLRDFAPAGGDAAVRPTTAPAEPPTAEHPLTIVLGTEADRLVDWLHAGEALMDLWLRATVEGVQASPLGQVIDLEWTRERLGAELGVVGHPQMVLRLGYAHPGPDTPRRPVSEVLG